MFFFTEFIDYSNGNGKLYNYIIKISYLSTLRLSLTEVKEWLTIKSLLIQVFLILSSVFFNRGCKDIYLGWISGQILDV